MSKTKLDHLYGVTTQNVDLTPINNKITALENKDTQLQNSINTLNTNTVKKNEANTFSQTNKFSGNADAIIIANNQRSSIKWTDASGGLKFNLGRTDTYSNILETSDNYFEIKVPNDKRIFLNGKTEIRGQLVMGWGSSDARILPEDNSIKYLKLKDAAQPNRRFNIDLENSCRIMNLPVPASNTDAIRKQDIKDIVAVSSDWNDFKNRIGSW